LKTLVIPPRLVRDLVVTTFRKNPVLDLDRRVSNNKLPFFGKLTKDDIILVFLLSLRDR